MSSSVSRNKTGGPFRSGEKTQACDIIGRYDDAQDVHVFISEANPLAWIETADGPIDLKVVR